MLTVQHRYPTKQLHLAPLEHHRAKIAGATVETICFQDEIPVILNASLELEMYIKGHHVYKEV